MKNIGYRKTVALQPIITRNADAATRTRYIQNLPGVGGPVHSVIVMACQRTVTTKWATNKSDRVSEDGSNVPEIQSSSKPRRSAASITHFEDAFVEL